MVFRGQDGLQPGDVSAGGGQFSETAVFEPLFLAIVGNAGSAEPAWGRAQATRCLCAVLSSQLPRARSPPRFRAAVCGSPPGTGEERAPDPPPAARRVPLGPRRSKSATCQLKATVRAARRGSWVSPTRGREPGMAGAGGGSPHPRVASRRRGSHSGRPLSPVWRRRRRRSACHRLVYVLPELLLRPPLGVGILLPTFAEVPDLVTAGPLPAARAGHVEHRRRVPRDQRARQSGQPR